MNPNDQNQMDDQVVKEHQHIIREGDVQAQSHLGHLLRRVLQVWMLLVVGYEGHHFVRVVGDRCHDQTGCYLENGAKNLAHHFYKY